MQEIIVAANEAGQRLDKMLAKYLNEAPKSFLYKMLRKKNIVLNGKKFSYLYSTRFCAGMQAFGQNRHKKKRFFST